MENKIAGFWDIEPEIKKISFRHRGKISIHLEDGREIIFPVSAFLAIKKMTPAQRKKWYIFGNGFSFDDCNDVFHIEQILGNFQKYKHEA
jgi:hypothetical protein